MASESLLSARREALGLTQGELAERAGTSRERISSYERGRVHPTVDTFERVLAAMGSELVDVPVLTFEERRSLAVSKAVARRLAAEPDVVIATARRNLGTMHTAASNEQPWLVIWRALLDLGPEYVGAVLVSKDQFSRDLRQSSPFAGVLTADERRDAVAGLRR